ncbi:MAG TPA: ARMT1-like domain-containing protein, partial [Polyangia bacterium]|nr:ARMT1-like domain-containing protein [Polyangia bacterium]
DLGHPPFGHAGERALDEAMSAYGGFDHNAQTLRILTTLEHRYAGFDGLNLVWESLEGVVKHNGPLVGADAPRRRPLPAAIEEYAARQDLWLDTWPGLEAQVASLADDIAYNTHDVDDGLRALEGSGQPQCVALAARVRAWREGGKLVTATHPFYTSSLFYPALPADLRQELGRSNLVILKGDANYRRLCSDAPWPPETPFAEVVSDFPAPLVAVRTCKAEVMVGLPPGVAPRLSAADPTWMVNGRRGVIQARL